MMCCDRIGNLWRIPVRACSVGTVPFRSPIQMVRFLPFQNGKNPLFTMETVAERNGTVPTEQALRDREMGLFLSLTHVKPYGV